jgi:hypothetical protein
MSVYIIEIDPADTFASLRDRLLHERHGRVALVAPRDGVVMRHGIDLILLRRLTERERLEVGLVTSDRALAARARAAGLPAFPNLIMAEHYRPGWWRGRRQHVRLGFAPGDKLHPPDSQPKSEISILAAVVGIVGLALIGLIAALLVFAPRATVTVRPASRPLQVIVEVTADPFLTQVESAAVPAQKMRHLQRWEASGESTGDPAADRRRIRALALQGLGSAMEEYLVMRVLPGEMFVPGSARFTVVEESMIVDESGLLRFSLSAELTGLALAHADLNHLTRQRLDTLLPAGYRLDPGTLHYSYEASTENKESFNLTVHAWARAEIDPAGLRQDIRGRRTIETTRYLDRLPLAGDTRLRITPEWWAVTFDRVPLVSDRIRLDVLP